MAFLLLSQLHIPSWFQLYCTIYKHCISRTIVFLALTLPLSGLLIFRHRTFLIPLFNFCFASVSMAQQNDFFPHGQQQIRTNLSHCSHFIARIKINWGCQHESTNINFPFLLFPVKINWVIFTYYQALFFSNEGVSTWKVHATKSDELWKALSQSCYSCELEFLQGFGRFSRG